MDHTAQDDTALALAAQQGDQAAFEQLAQRYQRRVYAVAWRLTGRHEDALDVTQDALLKAWTRLDRWKPIGPFGAWLLRLTSNEAIDRLRRRKRLAEDSLEQYGVERTTGTSNVERDAHASEIALKIRCALVVLSERQRTVFMLRHYEGYSLEQIAGTMGCSSGSVKVHLFRALRKLRVSLQDFYLELNDEE